MREIEKMAGPVARGAAGEIECTKYSAPGRRSPHRQRVGDFAPHMAVVARHLLGEPNYPLSSRTELRFGRRGSLAVDLEKGTWFDHEANQGGGVLDLIRRETGRAGKAAVEWLEREAGIEVDAGPAPKRMRKTKLGKVAATYAYCDEAGQLLFEVCRYEPKDFRQRRPDGRGGWLPSLDDTRRVLYRLPELLEADAAEPVFVVEGEKDTDNLRALGIVATTSPQGAGKWTKCDRAALAGRHVIVIPDNDDAGRQHAADIVRDLTGKAASVKALELPGLPPKGDVSNWLDAGGTAEELRQLAAEAPERRPGEAADEAVGVEERPLIRIHAGELHVSAEKGAEALAGATLADPARGTYRRSGGLVRLVRLASGPKLERGGIKRARGALVIAPADPDYLMLELTRCARWERFDGRADDWRATDAPARVAKSIAAASDRFSPIPPLAGIIEAPTIRSDGSLLDAPGYDATTGILFDPAGVDFPPIPAEPSREQAEAALRTLREPLAEFPFVDETSESVILSKLITAITRKAMRAAPLYVIKAPKMASGKTLLATIGSYVATGRAPAMMSQAEDPESERKRLLAVLLEGAPMVVLDNIERPLKSDALCSVLTEPLFTDRLLGASRTATAATDALFVATGNNLVIAGDLTARAVTCILDPQCERPEERRFKTNLHETVPRRRGELVAAALTIVRAYLAAGAPLEGKLVNFARFEDWSRFAREPLVWLGMADPCLTRKEVEAADPIRQKLSVLLAGWHEAFGRTAATIAQAIQVAGETISDPDAQSALRYPVLAEAITAIADERGRINSRRLARFIASHAGRIEDGVRFVRGGERQHATLWSAEVVSSVSSVSAPGTNAENCQNKNKNDISIGLSENHSRNSRNSPPAPSAADEGIPL